MNSAIRNFMRAQNIVLCVITYDIVLLIVLFDLVVTRAGSGQVMTMTPVSIQKSKCSFMIFSFPPSLLCGIELTVATSIPGLSAVKQQICTSCSHTRVNVSSGTGPPGQREPLSGCFCCCCCSHTLPLFTVSISADSTLKVFFLIRMHWLPPATWDHSGSKTLLQQNSLIPNWRCQPNNAGWPV